MEYVNSNKEKIQKISSLIYHATNFSNELNKILKEVDKLLPDIKCAIEGIELINDEIKKVQNTYNNGTGCARREAFTFLKSKGVV